MLRAGTREERRVLSRPAADAKVDRGGLRAARAIPSSQTYVPVEVTVEARDNDAVSGPKWGKSAPHPVIRRRSASPRRCATRRSLEARDALTDLIAYRVREKAPTAADAKEHVGARGRRRRPAVKADAEALAAIVRRARGAGRAPRWRAGSSAGSTRRSTPRRSRRSRATHQKLLDETEEALLALDAGVRVARLRDARSVAKRLADVADEAAAALRSARAGRAPADADGRRSRRARHRRGRHRARRRRQAAAPARRAGPRSRRDRRQRSAPHRPRPRRQATPARRAGGARSRGAAAPARAVVQRRRRSRPRRRARRRRVGRGRPGAEAARPVRRDEEAAAAEHELEELAREHAGKMSEVEEALEKRLLARGASSAPATRPRSTRDAIREAVKKLPPLARAVRARPSPPPPPGARRPRPWPARSRAAARATRSRPGATPRRSSPRPSGRGAGGGFFPEDEAGRDAAHARPTLDRELAWAEEALEKLPRRLGARQGRPQAPGKAEQRLAEKAPKLIVSWVPGSPIDCAAMMPTASPSSARFAGAQVAAVAHHADAALGLAGQRGPDAHPLEAGVLDLLGQLLVDLAVGLHDDLAGVRIAHVARGHAPQHPVAERLDDVARPR